MLKKIDIHNNRGGEEDLAEATDRPRLHLICGERLVQRIVRQHLHVENKDRFEPSDAPALEQCRSLTCQLSQYTLEQGMRLVRGIHENNAAFCPATRRRSIPSARNHDGLERVHLVAPRDDRK